MMDGWWLRIVLVALPCTGIALAPTAARAQALAELRYRAPEPCPGADRFASEVDARLGREAFGAPAEGAGTETMKVEIVAASDGWLGTLSFGSPSMRAFRDRACDALVRTLATAAVVALDTTREARATATPVPRTEEPAPVVVATQRSERTRPSAAAADEARVVVRSSRPGLTLHRVTRSGAAHPMLGSSALGFERLCTAPCAVRLPRGMQHFGVSQDVSATVSAEELVAISGDTAVTIGYEDRSAWRILGWSLIGLSVPAGVASALYTADRADGDDGAGLALGVGLVVASLVMYVVGFGFTLDGDDVTVRADGPL